MKKATQHLLCGMLLLTLSTAVLAQDTLTQHIPVAIAAGEYAQAEMLITEAVKIGLLSTAAAAAYRGNIQQAREGAATRPQDKKNTSQSPKNEPEPERTSPAPYEPDSDTDQDARERQGRIYVTYTKLNMKTRRYYSGRTSMVINMDKPLLPQARKAVDARDTNHHIDENGEPQGPAFQGAEIDRFDVGTAVNYENRYRDIAYFRIRGREQQLIDFYGGAQSETRKTGGPDRTENAVRAVARDHPLGRQFHEAATAQWGMLAPYTGD
jgi:hypothetical protein